MTLPSEVGSQALGRGGGEETAPVAGRAQRLLRWLVVAAFAFRAVLSALDAQAAATDGVRTLPFVSTVELGSSSAVWPAMWGILAAAAAATLALRIRLSWLLAVAVTTAYLAVGISDVATLAGSFGEELDRQLQIIGVELVAPLVVLSALFSIREMYIPAGRVERLHPRRQIRQATPPTLERWRRP